MKTEKGITIIAVVITVMIMAILATLLVRASIGQNLFKELNTIEEDFSKTLQSTNQKTQSIKDAWEGVI